MTDKKHDARNRVFLYTGVLVIIIGLVSFNSIINSINISKAEKCFFKADYVCAFKYYRKAFSGPVDNSKHISHYYETLSKIKKVAVVQEELYNLLERYPDSPVSPSIENIFWQLRENVKEQYPYTYIESVVQGTNVVHWNNKEGSISVAIDKSLNDKYPGYYVQEVQNAFKDYTNITNGELRFEFIEDTQKANINIVFMEEISGGQCQNSDCASVLGLTENNISGSLLAKSTVKLRIRDIDNTEFTRNQIYNIAQHEIGHALGISGHSYNPADVMYPVSNDSSWSKYSRMLLIERKGFSKRDIDTIHLLYKIIPDITNSKYVAGKYPDMYYPIAVLGTKKQIGQNNLAESKKYVDVVSSGYIAQVNLGEAYFGNGEMEKAKEAFLNALNYANTHEEKFTVNNNIAVIYYSQNNYQKAIEYADIANTYSVEKAANEVKAYCYVEMKKYNEAQGLLEDLVAKSPQNATYSAALVGVYFKQFKIMTAFNELKRIKKANPEAVEDQVFRPYKIYFNFV